MTEYQVELGTQAQADIIEIMRYIGVTLQEPRTAGNLYRRLKEEISSLNQMPERYPYEAGDRLRVLGVRKLLVKNFKVLYLVNIKSCRVQIARIIYAGRNISKILESTEFKNQ